MLIQYLKKYKVLPAKLLNEALINFRKQLQQQNYDFIVEDHLLIKKRKYKNIDSIICDHEKLKKLVNIIINMYQTYGLEFISNLPIKICTSNNINADYAKYLSIDINEDNPVRGFMTFNFKKTNDSFIYPYSYGSYEIHLDATDSDLTNIIKHEIGHVLLHDNLIRLPDKLEESLIEYLYHHYDKEDLMIDLETFDKMNHISMEKDNCGFCPSGVCFIHYLYYNYFNSSVNIDEIYSEYYY